MIFIPPLSRLFGKGLQRNQTRTCIDCQVINKKSLPVCLGFDSEAFNEFNLWRYILTLPGTTPALQGRCCSRTPTGAPGGLHSKCCHLRMRLPGPPTASRRKLTLTPHCSTLHLSIPSSLSASRSGGLVSRDRPLDTPPHPIVRMAGRPCEPTGVLSLWLCVCFP